MRSGTVGLRATSVTEDSTCRTHNRRRSHAYRCCTHGHDRSIRGLRRGSGCELAGRSRRAGSPARRHPEGHDARRVLPGEAGNQRRRLGDVLERHVPHRHVHGWQGARRALRPRPGQDACTRGSTTQPATRSTSTGSRSSSTTRPRSHRRAARTSPQASPASSGVLSPAGPKAPPAKVTYTFPKVGSFQLICNVHPGMKVVVAVKPSGAPASAQRVAGDGPGVDADVGGVGQGEATGSGTGAGEHRLRGRREHDRDPRVLPAAC